MLLGVDVDVDIDIGRIPRDTIQPMSLHRHQITGGLGRFGAEV